MLQGIELALRDLVRQLRAPLAGPQVLATSGEVELQVPETGLTYFHVTRNAELVSTPPGINVFLKTNLRPGQATQATLWFKTPQGKAEAKTLDVRYHDKTLHFPPGPQVANR